ncbi:hypothetical protein CHU_3471 [Cytophaga hutchinsonii ATCC 33406]|uniref:Uncharacterized protein n=2 Tax=Cytophaga hutchinsonii TaxID=985 RepID=A0A6N4SW68_CYTH3|nr:hypothetical protein CHU_3471 [Cytophaga hutchinsonii ATCC 33406]
MICICYFCSLYAGKCISICIFSDFILTNSSNTMGAIGTILIVVGFIVGNISGYMLSNTASMKDSNGKVIKSKEVLFAAVIAISAIMILAGQYIVVAPNSY